MKDFHNLLTFQAGLILFWKNLPVFIYPAIFNYNILQKSLKIVKDFPHLLIFLYISI